MHVHLCWEQKRHLEIIADRCGDLQKIRVNVDVTVHLIMVLGRSLINEKIIRLYFRTRH